ncbi:MAG TPA: UvrD-helicase domain-containing protein [Steroidobacteraceae bacterium]|nr:UvrD-helicase domain-containing protein [Steroidobacteraceae bacterium]
MAEQGDLFAIEEPGEGLCDERAREYAADPHRSVLLQAPAGSGKTTVLTERLLRLLAQVNEPEEILAITFSRRAAAEMRDRVLKALRGAMEDGSAAPALHAPDALSQRLRSLAAAALARDSARGWNLAQDPGRLRIQTIDSFNFTLASQLTVTARAGGSLSITERPEELYAEAARATLASAEDDPQLALDVELLFERLDNNWRNVEQLLADMLQRRGHWLRYVLGHEPHALCARINESLGHIVREQLVATLRRIPGDLLAQAAALAGVGRLGAEPETLGEWKRLGCLALTGQGEWRKSSGLTRAQGPGYELAATREALAAVIERMSDVPGLRFTLLDVAALPSSTLATADAGAIEALSRVLRFAAAHLQAIFAAAGRVDYTYVAGAARAALIEAGLPTELALRTGLALRHILVDEFQDTSLAQLELIEGLVAGWEEGDGRTLFVVGDPMQSIYQFREAEVGLFLRARNEGIGSVPLQALRLTRNFRSIPELISWTNAAFRSLYPETDDLRASAVAFTASEPGTQGAAACPGEPVRLRFFADRDAETRAIGERIAELRAGDPQATLAILVASRSHATVLMAELASRHIEAVGIELVPLSELPIVRDLVALTRATSHLGDRSAWLALLRAPWCGLSLRALTALSGRRHPLLVWEALEDPACLSDCSTEDCLRLARVRDVLSSALSTRHTLALVDWLELTWLRLGAADAYPASELAHARAFFDALSQRVASVEWTGAQDLDSLLRDLYAQPQASSANPVQVMTIHRAKGLEFDHVFVPALDRDLNRGREPLLRWLDLPRAQGDSDLIMAPVPPVGPEGPGEVTTFLKRLAAQRAANERTRLLYVAATRAKKSLHLSAAPRPKANGTLTARAGTLLATLWPALDPLALRRATSEEFAGQSAAGAGPETTPSESAERQASTHLRRLVSRWSPPALARGPELSRLPLSRQSLEPPEFSWVQETARHIGTVVHAALESFSRAAQLPTAAAIEAQRGDYLQQLRRHGVPQRDLPRAAERVIDALKATVSDERGRWIFAPTHREARSELALTGLAAGRLVNVVVDRSFLDADGNRWVIDFKTSRHEGGGLEAFLEQEMQRYRPQLETYRTLARHLGEHPVRAALYFPLLATFRELEG